MDDLFRGAESYLGTWGAAEQPQGRRQPRGRGRRFGQFLGVEPVHRATSRSGPSTATRRTRWASDWSDDQWYQVDLGSARTVGRVTLDWERAYAKSYRIELSTDGVNWRTAWSTTAGDGGLDTARFTGTPARYVRVHGLERGTGWGYSLHEVGVHGG